ncbi:FAD-dependent monooxygenase [Cysteiniphilum sp. 6C5]|uniref:FAD-dependent monooxygenase n=1 Tax=unclassified Cysteiniphilum TaxID=2610889 RepID=UPI003F862706
MIKDNKKNNLDESHHDIVIIGGGAVGMLMALSLAKLGKQITLIEKLASAELSKSDNRSVALSYSSVCVLETLGIWQNIKADVEYIKQVHVSDKGQYAQTNLYAKDEGLAFLGIVVKMRHLLSALYQALMRQSHITLYQDCQVLDLLEQDDRFSLVIEKGVNTSKITADLIIAADGAQSKLREKAGILARKHDYQQSALVFDLDLQRAHNNIAYERFINNGVLALLPVNDRQMACVWSVDHDRVDYWMAQSKQTVLKEIQRLVGYRLGRFVDVSELKSFPLSLIRAQTLYRKNVLLFGNASHFLHPISGQGLNLSVRDIGIMYDLLASDDATLTAQNIADTLAKYQEVRVFDHKRTALLTHSMINVFRQDALPVKFARGFALHCLERDQHLKKAFSKLMMGKYNHGSTLMHSKHGKSIL